MWLLEILGIRKKKKKKKDVPGSRLIFYSAFKNFPPKKRNFFCFSLSKCNMLVETPSLNETENPLKIFCLFSLLTRREVDVYMFGSHTHVKPVLLVKDF